jgi:hypothetical protein
VSHSIQQKFGGSLAYLSGRRCDGRKRRPAKGCLGNIVETN